MQLFIKLFITYLEVSTTTINDLYLNKHTHNHRLAHKILDIHYALGAELKLPIENW